MPLRPTLAALFLSGLFLAACGNERTEIDPAPTALLADEHFVIEAVDAGQLAREVQMVDADYVVVNFWASWCLPCREEFPEFMRFDRAHDDVAVRFVSLDFDDEVDLAAEFLREQGVTGTTYMQIGRAEEFIDSISTRWTGAIPASAIYDSDGNLLAFWEGKVDYDDLVQRVAAVRTSS
jgi:thiol-disulfide isomerase/thioredoxin